MSSRLLALFLLFYNPFVFAAPQDVLAVIDSRKITQEDFDFRYNEVVSKTINAPTKEQFLEDLIRYEMGLQEAKKRNLINDPIIKERINQEIYKGLIERELSGKIEKIEVVEKEMKAYYRNNPQIRTSHILIQLKPNPTDEERKSAFKRAQEIYKEVKGSKRPFKDLVRLYTDDTFNKDNGGDVGWQSRVTLVPNYYDAAVKLKTNALSDLVETQFGFHIVQLTGKRPYEDADKAQIRAAVYDEKRRNIFNNYFANLKKKYKIKVLKKPN